ncbi:Hsp33 family molecular chaperone HslO [Eubacteriales bacterium OttesenSCG-928-A19]|nr:Hsp33 family molecular chaperone HslO [Eubacteriales bacterium OttesenSCG-928-A19]
MKTMAMGRLLRGILMNGQARVLLCDTKDMVQAARETHQASRVCTAALGRAISGVAMLTAAAEEEANSVTMTIKGGGPAGSLVAVAHGRSIKAYIDHPQIELPPKADGKLDVGGALGKDGRLTVVRDLGLREPYVGQTPLQSGEVADDLAYYCTMSEQQPTLCALGVLAGDMVLSAGGLIVQPLPGCEEETLSALELRAPIYAGISAHLAESTPEQLFESFFRGLSPEIIADETLAYTCDCSRERMEKVLISLGREELDDMISRDHGAEITCYFCREQHKFDENELRQLLKQATSVDE